MSYMCVCRYLILYMDQALWTSRWLSPSYPSNCDAIRKVVRNAQRHADLTRCHDHGLMEIGT
jgi:hypothetical protein